MINLLIYILIMIVVFSVVWWLISQIVTEPKLLKAARIILAVIALIIFLYIVLGYLGPINAGPHRLFRY